MIDAEKRNHIYKVALFMKNNAEKFGLDDEEMFMLGLVHDIGFEFGGSENHHKKGYELLKSQNYKYAQEVLYHGMPTDEYSSKALDLLNFADMQIDKKGNFVSFEERLEDIKDRRGEDSPHYKNSKKIIEYLKNKYLI